MRAKGANLAWSLAQLPTDQCVIWPGGIRGQGYGMAYTQDKAHKPINAHNLVYKVAVGPIPEGLVLDHLCRVRKCVNPTHMEPVTPIENYNRGLKVALKTHCKHGHEFTRENTYAAKRQRHCRTCMRESSRRADAKKKAERTAFRAARLVRAS